MNNNKQYTNELINHLKRKDLIVFAGAGISIPSGLPTGNELITKLLELLDTTRSGKTDYDLPIITQVIKTHEGPRYKRLFNDIFNRWDLHPNDLHYILAMLSAKCYITTNYDLLLEKALGDLYGADKVAKIINDGDISKSKVIDIIKLHGDVNDPNSIVLTYDEYLKRFEENPLLEHLIYILLSRNPILFVGYSLRDFNILPILHKISSTLNSPPDFYAILFEPDNIGIKFYESLKIKVIELQKNEVGDRKQPLYNYLFDIWSGLQNFSYFIQPKPQLGDDFKSLINLAYIYYKAGNYNESLNMVSKLHKKNIENDMLWKAYPSEFSQYAYYMIKIRDKLNMWIDIEIQNKLLIERLSQVGKYYNEDIQISIKNQINWGTSVPLWRMTKFIEAKSYINKSLDGLSPDVINSAKQDELPILADQHTVLALINLSLYYFPDNNDEKEASFEKISDELKEAKRIYDKYHNTDPGEVHYEGRYYGAVAFGEIAKIHKKKPMKDETLISTEEIESILNNAKKSHNNDRKGKTRVPYGLLAGKYCEAIARFFIAKHCKDKKEEFINRSVEIIEKECFDWEEIKKLTEETLVKYKLTKALEIIYKEKGDEKKQGILRIELDEIIKKDKDKEFPIFKNMNTEIIKSEDWLYTPLN